MKRLEIIHLRTAETSFTSLTRQIRDAIGSGFDGAGGIAIYRRSGLDSDVAIHISGDGGGGTAGPSALGLHLASALTAFGLVEHTVWEELT